jgi:hypothetical protein
VIATVEICDRCEAVTDLGLPNVALVDFHAAENYPANACPLCKASVPVTRF